MHYVIKEIQKIRNENNIKCVECFNNPYSVLVDEKNRTHTLYCFSLPIKRDSRFIDRSFSHYKNKTSFEGSNGNIVISNNIMMKNDYGECYIDVPGILAEKTIDSLFFTTDAGKIKISPTTNGLTFLIPCSMEHTPKFRLHLNQKPFGVRSNGKYYAWMREKFIPFLTVSAIGYSKSGKSITEPCIIETKEINEYDYLFSCSPVQFKSGFVLFEINLYEKKLFQDTTVESKNPKQNNAFGSTAFLGRTEAFGEQWLYFRAELNPIIPHLTDRKILRVQFYLPCFCGEKAMLSAHSIQSRFCSFGSNWTSRVAPTIPLCMATNNHGYYAFDLPNQMMELTRGINIVIRQHMDKISEKATGIYTGDSYYRSPILKINYI